MEGRAKQNSSLLDLAITAAPNDAENPLLGDRKALGKMLSMLGLTVRNDQKQASRGPIRTDARLADEFL